MSDGIEDLLARHLPGLREFVRLRMSPLLRAHESAEDVLQSACCELLPKAGIFAGRGEPTFRDWLYGMVSKHLVGRERALRSHRRHARHQEPSAERVSDVQAALQTLPAQYREVIALTLTGGLDFGAVAARMGRSVDSVRELLHRALEALVEVLRRHRNDGEAP